MDSLLDFKKKNQFFGENGFFIHELTNTASLQLARDGLEDHLKKISGISNLSLENYHLHFEEDEKHYNTQYELLNFYRENEFGRKILEENLDIFKYILGPDLEIQREPYLRITRPNKNKDNIGYHRDTYYGTSPTEISILIPFVNLDDKNSLSIYPKSHTYPDSKFTWKPTVSQDVVKNSKKHQMGFLYAPKIMDSDINEELVPQPLAFGQVLVFMLSVIHGSISNTGCASRWSSDIRIKHTASSLSENMKANYYMPLSSSVVNLCYEQLVKK